MRHLRHDSLVIQRMSVNECDGFKLCDRRFFSLCDCDERFPNWMNFVKGVVFFDTSASQCVRILPRRKGLLDDLRTLV